jgi:hypothetical protein
VPNESHLVCHGCGENVTVARLDSVAKLVCQCTHVDGGIDPVDPDPMAPLPGRWEFVTHGRNWPGDGGGDGGE